VAFPAGLFVRSTEEKPLKVVRMYAKEIERSKYPIPTHPESTCSTSLDTKLNCIALHELIRRSLIRSSARRRASRSESFGAFFSERNSFSAQIRGLDAKFKAFIAAPEDAKPCTALELIELIQEYKKATKLAEVSEMKDADIVLCTATAANPHRLHFLSDTLVVQQVLDCPRCTRTGTRTGLLPQVILDEASMSGEAESLIPLVTTGCRQVIMVGDHKQLKPVVLSSEARDFGMDSTFFAKYAEENSIMLETQYRMVTVAVLSLRASASADSLQHEAIAEFPSRHFYSGRLTVGGAQQREKSEHPQLWPGGAENPLVFCHCEGAERQAVVATEEAAEMSASNSEEVAHVVSPRSASMPAAQRGRGLTLRVR
jgi:AAA domain